MEVSHLRLLPAEMMPNPNANPGGLPIIGVQEVEHLEEDQEDEIAYALGITGPAKKISAEDFNFQKVIGRGSFGKVYMAVKKDKANSICATKVLNKRMIAKKNLLIKTQGKARNF